MLHYNHGEKSEHIHSCTPNPVSGSTSPTHLQPRFDAPAHVALVCFEHPLDNLDVHKYWEISAAICRNISFAAAAAFSCALSIPSCIPATHRPHHRPRRRLLLMKARVRWNKESSALTAQSSVHSTSAASQRAPTDR
jgi:hypothetical protein